MKTYSETLKVALKRNHRFLVSPTKATLCSLVKHHLQQQISPLKSNWFKRGLHLRTSLALSEECLMGLSKVALAMLKLKLQPGKRIIFFFSKTCFYSLKYF